MAGSGYTSRGDSCVFIGPYNANTFFADEVPPLIGQGSVTVSEGGVTVLASTYEIVSPSEIRGGWDVGRRAWFAGFDPSQPVRIIYYSHNADSEVIPLPEDLQFVFFAQEAYRAILGDEQTINADPTGMIFVDTDVLVQRRALVAVEGQNSGRGETCAILLGPDLDVACGTALATFDDTAFGNDAFDDLSVIFGDGPKTIGGAQ